MGGCVRFRQQEAAAPFTLGSGGRTEVNCRRLVVCVIFVGLVCGLSGARGADGGSAELAPSQTGFEQWLADVKQPTDWFEWGGDLRLRQVYHENAIDFLNEFEDTRHFFRIRARVWGRFGPFFVDEDLGVPNGLSAYVRLTAEPRYFIQRELVSTVPVWDEVVWDNLYLDWQRIGGAPVSVRVGRQDILYGRGFVILDGTPLDGSRTIYSDAIKATLHLDEQDTVIDLLWIDNKGNQKRFRPFNETEGLVSEFDATVVGTYLINRSLEGHELHGYYLYKDEDNISGKTNIPGGRIVHTVGGLAQGKFCDNWDYYAEAAYQWGKEGTASREGWGLSADLGYTFADTKWTPRVHAGYEYLSGDDRSTSQFEGWDPVLARWPHWSELFVYRWAFEGGQPGLYTNVQRYTLGGRIHPCEQTTVDLDYSYLRANEHPFGTTNVFPMMPYDTGYTRGHLVVATLKHTFNKYMSGHLWAEYFHPEDYYAADADEAVFLRWQLMFKF